MTAWTPEQRAQLIVTEERLDGEKSRVTAFGLIGEATDSVQAAARARSARLALAELIHAVTDVALEKASGLAAERGHAGLATQLSAMKSSSGPTMPERHPLDALGPDGRPLWVHEPDHHEHWVRTARAALDRHDTRRAHVLSATDRIEEDRPLSPDEESAERARLATPGPSDYQVPAAVVRRIFATLTAERRGRGTGREPT